MVYREGRRRGKGKGLEGGWKGGRHGDRWVKGIRGNTCMEREKDQLGEGPG